MIIGVRTEGKDHDRQIAPVVLTRHRRPLKALTGIRFFAAFYVVIFHSRVGTTLIERGHLAAGHFFTNGFLAVPLFFLLSGFILTYTYAGQIEGKSDYRRFWEARFSRIWPVYAVSLLLSTLACHSTPSLHDGIATVLMLQAWSPYNHTMAGAWNFVCWTLSVEAFFYLCFPPIQVWLERFQSRAYLVWIAVMLLLCLILNSAGCSLGTVGGRLLWRLPMPLVHLPEFLTGVGLGNYFLSCLSLQASRPTMQLLRGAGLWTYASAALTVALLCRVNGMWTSLIVISFAALLYGLAAEETLLSRLLSTRAMLLGGGISYSIYLVQVSIKAWGNEIAAHLHVESLILRLCFNSILLVVVSLILFEFVEDPTRKLLRSIFAGIEGRRKTSSSKRETVR